MASWVGVLGLGFVVVVASGCGGNAQNGTPSSGGAEFGGAAGAGAAATSGGTSSGGSAIGGTATGGTATGGSGGGSATGGSGTGGITGTAGAGGAFVIPPDAGSGKCPDFTPCGGDPTGTWTISESCFDPPLQLFKLFCSDAVETYSLSGTLTFGPNGAFSENIDFSSQEVLSAQCVSTLGGCGTGLTANCVAGTAGTCVCTSKATTTNAPTGWEVAGNVLILDHQDGSKEASYFCERPKQLMLRASSSNGQIVVYTLTR